VSPSASLAPMATAAETVSSLSVTLPVAATVGAVFVGVMVTVTTCSAVPPWPSETRIVKLSEPLALALAV
jgi:uncharacterized membrane protein YphA (DoxX/SURF4 family)